MALVILGGGPVGRFANDIALACHLPVHGFLDALRPIGSEIEGRPVLGGLEDVALLKQLSAEHEFYVALGGPEGRGRLARIVAAAGGRFATLVHPWVVRAPSTRVGNGCLVNAFSYLHSGVSVGDGTMIESHVSIGTDVLIGSNVSVTQGVQIAARARVADDCFLGTGCVVLPDVVIGAGATIGAGAVVNREVPAGLTVVGNPARQIGQARSRL